jgi:hypothetical protein
VAEMYSIQHEGVSSFVFEFEPGTKCWTHDTLQLARVKVIFFSTEQKETYEYAPAQICSTFEKLPWTKPKLTTLTIDQAQARLQSVAPSGFSEALKSFTRVDGRHARANSERSTESRPLSAQH